MMEREQTLRDLRLSRGIYQSELAKILGVERSTISKWETGTNIPDLAMIKRIAGVFDKPLEIIAQMFGGEQCQSHRG